MRPVVSREEAEAIIDSMPDMPALSLHERNFTQLAARYQQLLCSHDCADIAASSSPSTPRSAPRRAWAAASARWTPDL